MTLRKISAHHKIILLDAAIKWYIGNRTCNEMLFSNRKEENVLCTVIQMNLKYILWSHRSHTAHFHLYDLSGDRNEGWPGAPCSHHPLTHLATPPIPLFPTYRDRHPHTHPPIHLCPPTHMPLHSPIHLVNHSRASTQPSLVICSPNVFINAHFIRRKHAEKWRIVVDGNFLFRVMKIF